MTTSPEQIIQFWFEEIDAKFWFRKDKAFDQILTDRFLETQQAAAQSELFDWRVSAQGRLAEIIVLDQFSRNLYRNSAKAFASDSLALALAQEAIAQGCDKDLSQKQRTFLYMPFMHSESLKVHKVAVELFTELGKEENLEYEIRHKEIIERFGRYPHRNDALGRVSSAEEIEFLKQPGSSF